MTTLESRKATPVATIVAASVRRAAGVPQTRGRSTEGGALAHRAPSHDRGEESRRGSACHTVAACRERGWSTAPGPGCQDVPDSRTDAPTTATDVRLTTTLPLGDPGTGGPATRRLRARPRRHHELEIFRTPVPGTDTDPRTRGSSSSSCSRPRASGCTTPTTTSTSADEDYRDLYRDLVLVRRVDVEATALQRQGELGLWASLLGQEAAQVGSGPGAGPDDFAFPTYREHGVALTPRASTR